MHKQKQKSVTMYIEYPVYLVLAIIPNKNGIEEIPYIYKAKIDISQGVTTHS